MKALISIVLLLGLTQSALAQQSAASLSEVAGPEFEGPLGVVGGDDCAGGVILDDGSFENGLTPLAPDYPFVNQFNLGNVRVVRVCTALTTLEVPKDGPYDIVFYNSDGGGGEPGTELARIPTSATAVPVIPSVSWYSVDTNVVMPGGLVYIGLELPGDGDLFWAIDETTFNESRSHLDAWGPLPIVPSTTGGTRLLVESLVSRATFEVNKDFTDGNPAGVEVTISCNTGLPLEQSKVITEGAGVEFVVTDFDDGEMDCEITEDVPAGYEVEYFNGAVTNDISCAYEDVTFESEVACRITNTPGPVDVVIHKDWVIEGGIGEDDGISQEFRVTLTCESEIVGGYQVNGDWRAHADRDGEATITFEVIPEFPSTTCEVEETVFDSAVEVDSGCGEFEVSAADGHECTITNTVFFEGIPTLNQYGLAILALLMLGLGFVGFRRFV